MSLKQVQGRTSDTLTTAVERALALVAHPRGLTYTPHLASTIFRSGTASIYLRGRQLLVAEAAIRAEHIHQSKWPLL